MSDKGGSSDLQLICTHIATTCELYLKNFDGYRPVDTYINRLEKLIQDYRTARPRDLGVSVSDGVGTRDKSGG